MSDRPDAIESIFAAAVALPVAERAAFLVSACGGDNVLQARLEVLLRAHEQAGHLLDRQLPGDDDPTRAMPNAEPPGTVIAGRYKLVEAIGEGGMGSVWVAEQKEPVKRKVAIKLIKAGMDSKQVLARFEAERQALALMDHPNIAKVFDGGVTAQGRPFFVMEYVKGVALTEYCDQAKLALAERLALFASVCQAVQHAHQKGIIHRDLKPSNILVCLYDGVPVPKVIDFGLAKATSQPLTEQSLYTAHGMMVGTPMYMSPEQAEHNNLDVDTRTDIYSLGVVLYELLTGSTPLGRQQLKEAAFHEILRLIREVEPPKPSTRISGSASLPSIAAQRGIEPKLLRKSLSGDLDWIVMKALEKERSRRYETANGLAADINRFLAGEPVLAHPPSRAYRFSKFLRKNQGLVLAASFVFLALVAGIIGTSIGLYRASVYGEIAENQRKEAERQRTKALAAADSEAEQRKRAEAAEDESLQGFRENTDDAIADLIGSQDQLGPREKSYLTNTLTRWKRFADRIGDDQRSRAIRGEAHVRVGLLWHHLGQKEEALAEYKQGLHIWEDLVDQFPAVPKYQTQLARARNNLGRLWISLSKPTEGRQEYLAAKAIGEKLLEQFPDVPEYQRIVADAYTGAGHALEMLGDSVEAQEEKQMARKVLQQLVTTWPAKPEFQEGLARNYYERGHFYFNQGNPGLAEREFQAALNLNKSLVDAHPAEVGYQHDVAVAYLGLSEAHRGLGQPGKSVAESRAGLEILGQSAAQFPSEPGLQEDLALAHQSVAWSLLAMGRRVDAFAEMRAAQQIFEKLVATFPNDPKFQASLAKNQGYLGMVLFREGKFDEALVELKAEVQTLQHLTAQFPDVERYHDSLGRAQGNYAETLKDAGRLDESLNWFNQSIQTLEPIVRQVKGQSGGIGPLEAAHEGRAQTLHRLHQYAAAIKDFDNTIAFGSDVLKPIFRASRARSYALDDRVAEALAEVEALEQAGYANTVREIDSKIFSFQYNFACVYAVASSRNPDKQQEYADRAMEHLNQALSQGFKVLARLEQDIELDPLREREDFKKLLADVLASRLPADPVQAVAARFSVNWAAVFPHYVEAWQRHREIQGSDHPDTLNASRELAEAQAKLLEFMDALRAEFPANDPKFAAQLAQVANSLLTAEQFAAAEGYLRECIAIRETTQPDEWRTFNARAMLGDSLRGQSKYDEAEPLLLAGYDGMKQREAAMNAQERVFLVRAMERLVALYTATGSPDQSAAWKKKLGDYQALLLPPGAAPERATSSPAPGKPAPSNAAQPSSAVRNLIAQASRARRAQKWADAEQLLEEGLAQNPSDPQILGALVDAYQQHGQQLVNSGHVEYSQFLKSAKYLRNLLEIQPAFKSSNDAAKQRAFATIFYNEACALAREGETEKALASLRDALDAGFADVQLVDTDPDLDSLRKLPAFKAMQESIRGRK